MDVTERKIRAQEAELRQILDSTPRYLGVYGPCETSNFSLDESWLSQRSPEGKAERLDCTEGPMARTKIDSLRRTPGALRKVQYRTLILLTVLRYHSSIRSNLGFERRGRRQKSGGSVPAPIGESGKLLNPGGSR